MLGIEDDEACFEEFVKFSSGEFGKVLDVQFESFRKGFGDGFASAFSGFFLLELGGDDKMDIRARCFVAFGIRVAYEGFVVRNSALIPFGRLLRIRHDCVDDGGYFAKEFAVRFLCFGWRNGGLFLGVGVLFTVSCAIDEGRVFA